MDGTYQYFSKTYPNPFTIIAKVLPANSGQEMNYYSRGGDACCNIARMKTYGPAAVHEKKSYL